MRYVPISTKLAKKHIDGIIIFSKEVGKEPNSVVNPKNPAIIDRAPIVLLLNIFF